MRRGRRWMRLLRLVVACLFFVVARPALAGEPYAARGEIVLVADADQAEHAEDESPAPASTAPASSVPVARVPVLCALQSERALRDRTYLRHCALLR